MASLTEAKIKGELSILQRQATIKLVEIKIETNNFGSSLRKAKKCYF